MNKNQEIKEVLEQLKSQAEDHMNFSKGLWDSCDEANAHFQEGHSKGISRAVSRIEAIVGGTNEL